MMVSSTVVAQNLEGVVSYQKVMDPTKRLDQNPNSSRMTPEIRENIEKQMSRPVNYVLYIKGDESTYKPGIVTAPENVEVNIGGRSRAFRIPTPQDEYLNNYNTKKTWTFKEYAGQPFYVSGELSDRRWKLNPLESKVILGYQCMQATTSETNKSAFPRRDESGNTIMVDTLITTTITAWFTDALSSSAGPETYFGLPGLILEASINDGLYTISATNVEKREVTKDEIKINSKGKKVSDDQYKKIVEDHQKETMRSGGGRGPGGGGRGQTRGGE